MGKTVMQPVIMATRRELKPGRLLLMFADNCNNRVVLIHCKKVTGLTHFNNDNSV